MFADDAPDWNLNLDGSDVCELCGEEGAIIHLLRVEQGVVTHTRLCHKCAETVAGQTEGMALVLAVPAAIRRLGRAATDSGTHRGRPLKDDNRICGVCGTTSADLAESGMVGCSVCYEVFAERLAQLLDGEQDSIGHLGKVPRRGSEYDSLRHEIIRLKRMLSELVDTERFEEAASVRDRLAELSRGVAKGMS